MSAAGLRSGYAIALGSAALFGASTPLAATLLGQVPPLLLAGLLYLGSGTGLGLWLLVRRFHARPAGDAALRRADLPWLAGAVLTGGIAGPALLMSGLQRTDAAAATLLLNLEGVLTALVAWTVFGEHTDRRMVAGMLGIVAGAVVLGGWSAAPDGGGAGTWLVAAACLCWAADNNLTRPIADRDPVQIAAIKGAVAGTTNVGLALAHGAAIPTSGATAAVLLVGWLGYGISLVLFILAMRQLGTARAGACFATAPFAGALLAIGLSGVLPAWPFWVAAVLMAAGVWLHLSERHAHLHVHPPLVHDHRHRHDVHHQHDHPDGWDGREPHSHHHAHAPLRHAHPHTPDLHHRHRHDDDGGHMGAAGPAG